MIVDGIVILRNKAEWKKWDKITLLDECEEPKEYPCVPDARINGREESYAAYEYYEDVRRMVSAFEKAMKE